MDSRTEVTCITKSLQFETNKMDFRAGEDLQLTLFNMSGDIYNPSSTDRGWETVAQEEVCSRIGLELSPDQRAHTARTLIGIQSFCSYIFC